MNIGNLGQSFDVNELPQSDNHFEPLPAGWYTSTIVAAELCTTKAGNGQYIKVSHTITGPTHQGRIVFDNLNISNPNPIAENIGRQQLGDTMRAIGLTRVTDTDQLIGGNLQIKLKIDPARDGYEASNSVAGYKSIAGSAAPQMQMQSPAQPSAPAGGMTPPWAKK